MPLSAIQQVGYTQFNVKEVLGCICNVIHNTITPSCLESVPRNFGDTAAGTIKADKWRILATVYLPITLISLWESTDPQNNHPLKVVLDHTMDLVSAVYLACAHTTSSNHATAYQTYIASYVGKLKVIHPAFNV